MSELSQCPNCPCDYAYQDQALFICPECGHEWLAEISPITGDNATDRLLVIDANGNALADGDTVTLIKDLKVKGASSVIKVGTKIKNIRLTTGDHNLDCKVPGIGAMGLKSEFVRKV